MDVEQLYTKCLAQGAYYIKSGGEAAIIDPLREVDTYIEMAKKDGVTIKYIFETHFHADYVSGHVTLAEKTGATIVFGKHAQTKFDIHTAEHGETFQLGNITIKALHTPGHTLESTTYLLSDEAGQPHAIFTGDTLFLGDVGRPDLAQKSSLSMDDLAGMLFDSLRQVIMPLPDETIVYPGHGAGSACGKHMMQETVDTLGNQRKVNYALRADMTKEEFVQEVTEGLLPPPGYFPLNVELNKNGYVGIDHIVSQSLKGLSPAEFEKAMRQEGVVVLDVRDKDAFREAHIPHSLFIGLDGSFAPWAGDLLADISTPILLVAPVDREEEAIRRLARVGFDHTIGYLSGGVARWADEGKSTASIPSIDAKELIDHSNGVILDVRKESEYLSQHVLGARNIPLSAKMYLDISDDIPAYVHCAGGYRSMIAISILNRQGVHNLVDVKGGFAAIQQTDIATSTFVCPTTI